MLAAACVAMLAVAAASPAAKPKGAGEPAAPEKPAGAATAPPAAVTSIALPGAPSDGLTLDYLAVDRARRRVWVPAAGTGSVVVIDADTRAVHAISGFPTAEVERNGRKRIVGPSSATIGDGVVYVGDRADSSVCAIDAVALERRGCVTLASPPDGVAYVAKTKEVWVTTPRDQSITILDVSSPSAPKTSGRIALEGDPEGYAVDDAAGFFFTNYEDKDRTLRISIPARKVTATWEPASLPSQGTDASSRRCRPARAWTISTFCLRAARCTPRRPAPRPSPSRLWTRGAPCARPPRCPRPRGRATPS
jgi:hypothetical protein